MLSMRIRGVLTVSAVIAGVLLAAMPVADAATGTAAGAAAPAATRLICQRGRWVKVAGSELQEFAPTIQLSTGEIHTDCDMRPGAEHSGVAALQHTLIKCYDQPIQRDGSYGPRTRAALENAQRWENAVHRRGLVADGLYRHTNFKALKWPRHTRRDLGSPFRCAY